MKKVTQAINTLETLSELVKIQHIEIDYLRHIVHRYETKHGSEIARNISPLPEHVSFSIPISTKYEKLMCKRIDYKAIGLESNYMRIQKIINTLNEKS
jgi:hypothetical protein